GLAYPCVAADRDRQDPAGHPRELCARAGGGRPPTDGKQHACRQDRADRVAQLPDNPRLADPPVASPAMSAVSPLMHAIQNRDLAAAKSALERDASQATAPLPGGLSALMFALYNGMPEIADLLKPFRA